MSVATATASPTPPPAPPRALADAGSQIRFTVDQFHLMEAAGVFANDPHANKLELLDGYVNHVILGDSAEDPLTMKPDHVEPIEALTDLRPRFADAGCLLRIQLPVTLPPLHEPLPDGAIVRGTRADYANHHPGPDDILCLIEVADASRWRDRGPKLRAYATANVPTYIILHVPRRVAEVHTMPQPDDASYGRVETLAADATLELSTATGDPVRVPVGDLLPTALSTD